jgi:hypothetical protein
VEFEFAETGFAIMLYRLDAADSLIIKVSDTINRLKFDCIFTDKPEDTTLQNEVT